MQKRLLFLTLNVFSVTGGIEKVCRVAGKALHEISREEGYTLDIWSMHDDGARRVDERYFPPAVFHGYGGKRVLFVLDCIRRKPDVVVVSHINLLMVASAIKKLSPKTSVVLMAHGVEIWKSLPSWKRKFLKQVDLILPVSRFTKEKMLALHGLDESRLQVVNNCLDPFLPPANGERKNKALLKKYGLTPAQPVLLTLCRLSGTERNKGYDEVIRALPALREKFPAIRYLLAGKCEASEKDRLNKLIAEHDVAEAVIFTGFLPEPELADHFRLADVFVMPSRKEGFGLVFTEALFYGVPVIAGNCDGSVDAVAGGKFGLLVDPTGVQEIAEATATVLINPAAFLPQPQEVAARFGFPVYKNAVKKALAEYAKPHKKQIKTGQTVLHPAE